MNRMILEWTDRKFDDVNDGTDKHALMKSIGLGVIEGALNGITVIGTITVLGIAVSVVSSAIKK